MAEEAAEMFVINESEAKDNHRGHKFQEQSTYSPDGREQNGCEGPCGAWNRWRSFRVRSTSSPAPTALPNLHCSPHPSCGFGRTARPSTPSHPSTDVLRIPGLGLLSDAVHRFNQQPAEERMKYYAYDFRMPIRYYPSFNLLAEKVLEWKDTLRIRYTPDPANFDVWPASAREAALNYCKQIRVLGATLLGLLSEALSLHPDYLINKINCMGDQKLAMNYYPECPEPELTLGIGGHSDRGSLTVLLQDHVGGLQVSNDGHWVAVDPLPGSLVINLGDQIQILSNDRFKSVEHRAVTNAYSPRVSIATFFSMRSDSSIGFGPIQELLNESQPALYREIGSDEYLQYFLSRALDGKSCLESARLK